MPTPIEDARAAQAKLTAHLGKAIQYRNALIKVHEYKDELLKLKAKQFEETDPTDRKAVRELTETNTQIELIPVREKQAAAKLHAEAVELAEYIGTAHDAIKATADEEIERVTDEIEKAIRNYNPPLNDNGTIVNTARPRAMHHQMQQHIAYRAVPQTKSPGLVGSIHSGNPDERSRGMVAVIERAEELLRMLDGFFDNKQSWVSPNFDN